jgi:hypothetical protein
MQWIQSLIFDCRISVPSAIGMLTNAIGKLLPIGIAVWEALGARVERDFRPGYLGCAGSALSRSDAREIGQ